jgi:hypothetical protein
MRKAVLVQLVTGTVLLSFLGTEHPSWAVEKNISDCVTDGSCGKKGVETPNLPDVSKILASNEDGKINLNGCSGMMGSKA